MELFTPDFIASAGQLGLAVGILWWRIGKVERRVKEQNGRIGELEDWRQRQIGAGEAD